MAKYAAANVSCTVYNYDARGSLTSMNYPSGRIVRYGYGSDKTRPNAISATVGSSTSTVIANTIAYDADGEVRSWRWNGSSTSLHTVTRDRLFRVTRLEDRFAGVTRSRVHYTYDGDGDLLTERDEIAPTAFVALATTADITRTTDDDNRRDILTAYSGGFLFYDNEGKRLYDNNGGLTYSYSGERLLNTTGSVATGLGYNSLGEVTTIDNGNDGTVDITLGYGVFGEVNTTSTSTGVTQYNQDHEQRLVRIVPPGTVADYRRRFRFGLGRDYVEDFERTSASAFTRNEWVSLQGIPVAVLTSSQTDTGTLRLALSDRMGVPRKIRTSTGSASQRRLILEPFGNGVEVADASTTVRLLRRYAGQTQHTPGGLVFNGYRTLIPQLGVYTSPDPLHRQTITSSLGAGVYTYTANRPFVNQDPYGLEITVDLKDVGVHSAPPGLPAPKVGGFDLDAQTKIHLDPGKPGACTKTCDGGKSWKFDISITGSVGTLCWGNPNAMSHESGLTIRQHEEGHLVDFKNYWSDAVVNGYVKTEHFVTRADCEHARSQIAKSLEIYNDWVRNLSSSRDTYLPHGSVSSWPPFHCPLNGRSGVSQ